MQPAVASDAVGAHLTDAVLREPGPAPEAVVEQAQEAAPKKEPPLTAGWSGEHFYIRSPDGQFTISPYGYVNTDYRAYQGDGAPPDTFLIRRARFGFQGSYGSHFDFALLTDTASTTGSIPLYGTLSQRTHPAGVPVPGRPVQNAVRAGDRRRRHQPVARHKFDWH